MPCSTQRIEHRCPRWIGTGFRALWTLIRLLAVTVLLAFEPAVSLVLVGILVLGTGAAVTLRLSGDLPNLPFWWMLALSFGSLSALTAYRALIGLLSRWSQRVGSISRERTGQK